MVSKKRRIKRRKVNREHNKQSLQVVDPGTKFENFITNFFNEYIDTYGLTGIAYRYPVIPGYVQQTDVFVDSLIMGYVGVECKSLYEDKHENNKVLFENIINVNNHGVSQLERQHNFLDCAGRYGIMAFEFRIMNEAFLLPHRYVLDRWNEGADYLTFDEIIGNSYHVGGPGDLVRFIRNKCW